MSLTRVITLPSGISTSSDRRGRVYRPPPGPSTPAREAHLAAARKLDVGPMPAVRPGSSPLRSIVGGAVDTLGFRALRLLFTGAHRSELDESEHIELEGGWLARSERALETPELFFPRPGPVELAESRCSTLDDGGSSRDLELDSSGYSDRPTALRMLREHPENASAYLRWYRHPGRGRPAVLWLHGWGMGFPRLEVVVSRARELYRLGLDVCLYTLPYHGRRRPPGVTFAGSVFPSTRVTRTNEAFLQAVWECRAAMRWHRDQGGGPCGVIGLSLGGYLAAVLASVAPETAFAACLLPVSDIPALIWSNGEGTPERRLAEESGITFDLFCRSMAVHAPLSRSLAIGRERVLLVGARGDRIIPPLHTEVLWEHWGRPELRWIPGGHLLQFGRGSSLRQLTAWILERLGASRSRAREGATSMTC